MKEALLIPSLSLQLSQHPTININGSKNNYEFGPKA